jgi:Tfp pilus assembly protein PilN
MINLIPYSAQKKLKQEYWIRIVSLWSILLSAALLVLAVLMVPIYVLVSIQLNAQATDTVVAAEERSSLVDAEAALQQASLYARLVLNETASRSLTNEIARLNQLGGEGILFSNYVYQQAATGDTLAVSGIARTRADLAAFRDQLEAQVQYTNVVLPISALIQETDLDFSITLQFATSTS